MSILLIGSLFSAAWLFFGLAARAGHRHPAGSVFSVIDGAAYCVLGLLATMSALSELAALCR